MAPAPATFNVAFNDGVASKFFKTASVERVLLPTGGARASPENCRQPSKRSLSTDGACGGFALGAERVRGALSFCESQFPGRKLILLGFVCRCNAEETLVGHYSLSGEGGRRGGGAPVERRRGRKSDSNGEAVAAHPLGSAQTFPFNFAVSSLRGDASSEGRGKTLRVSLLAGAARDAQRTNDERRLRRS